MSFNFRKLNYVGVVLLLPLMTFQVVRAGTSNADSIRSFGNLEYETTGDSRPDIMFYSGDLQNIAKDIDDMNGTISSLSSGLLEVSAKSKEYKAGIINGLNGNFYKNNKIPSTATFEQVISKIENIPTSETPFKAIVRNYEGGNNTGLGIGTANSVNVNVEGVTSVNLAVNESITLPSGYYPNGITIQNNVKNIGQLDWSPTSADTTYISSGYYSGGTLDSSMAYDAGYNAAFTEGEAAGYERGYSVGYDEGLANRPVPQVVNTTASFSGSGAGTSSKTFKYTPQYDGELTYTLTFSGDSGLISFKDSIGGRTIKSGTKDKTVVVGPVQAGVEITIAKAYYGSDDDDWRDNAKVTVSYTLVYFE